MGSGPSVQYTADAIKAEQLRLANHTTETIVSKAFDKCIGDIKVDDEEALKNLRTPLTQEERNCVEEYTMHFTQFTKASFAQFQNLFTNLQREGQEKARVEMMAQQSRSDIKKMRGE